MINSRARSGALYAALRILVGFNIRFFDDGHQRVLARVTLGDAYQSYPGVAHGGILATILDETMGRAVLRTAPDETSRERFMFTAKMETRYRRPVPLHEEFIVRGRVENDRGRMAQVSGEIVLADGTVAVEASATLVDIPPEQIEHDVDARRRLAGLSLTRGMPAKR